MFDTESLCFESKGHDQDTEAACTTVLSFENSNSFALSVTAGLRQISSGTLRHPPPHLRVKVFILVSMRAIASVSTIIAIEA